MNVYTESHLTPEAWVTDAACAQADPDAFFPKSGDLETVRAAKRICASCPVAAQCLDYAIRTHPTAGIWGGVGVKHLQRLRRTA